MAVISNNVEILLMLSSLQKRIEKNEDKLDEIIEKITAMKPGKRITSGGGGGGGGVSDDAYAIGWDGISDTAPSKNAVYDKIESLPGAITNLDGGVGDSIYTTVGLSPLDGGDATSF